MKFSSIAFCAFLLISTQVLHAKTMIISDVDDTIKMTGVLSSKKVVVWNGLFRKKPFAGMSELYQVFSNKETTIEYVSGSPKIIHNRVSEFLEDNDFPQRDNLVLKDSLSDDTFAYKTEAIKALIEEQNPDKVILIGDDTEHDPEIYQGITILFPGIVESIYIRSVQNRELPKNPIIKTFFSAVEIGALELVKGKINVESLKKVTRGFVKQTNESGISLVGRYCPQTGRAEIETLKQIIKDKKVTELLEQTQAKIKKSCK